MKKKTYADGLKDAWELINNHGMSVIPPLKNEMMFVTISHGNSLTDTLARNVTFQRKSEPGILSWLTDKEWLALKNGKLPGSLSR